MHIEYGMSSGFRHHQQHQIASLPSQEIDVSGQNPSFASAPGSRKDGGGLVLGGPPVVTIGLTASTFKKVFFLRSNAET